MTRPTEREMDLIFFLSPCRNHPLQQETTHSDFYKPELKRNYLIQMKRFITCNLLYPKHCLLPRINISHTIPSFKLLLQKLNSHKMVPPPSPHSENQKGQAYPLVDICPRSGLLPPWQSFAPLCSTFSRALLCFL